jgi:molybdopterin molybdotransferase
MPEFLQLLPPPQALQRLLSMLLPLDVSQLREKVETTAGLGRITASPITAPHPLPAFRRSTVDGYAIIARDSYGASEGLPAYFQLVGEVPMGQEANFKLSSGECALIHTGGMIPEGSDAVVMLENTQIVAGAEIEVLRAAAPGDNILEIGEDVAEGEEVIPAGKRLGPADIGGLMALGITSFEAIRKPSVGIISSGDEIQSPHEALQAGKVRDVNAYSLSALVEECGGKAVRAGIVNDDAGALEEVAADSLEKNDMVVITAGSSASSRDLTAEVINHLGEPGVLVHGVSVRPGKPTILAVCSGKPVIGLPGNPVSALVISRLFVVPVVERLSGLIHRQPRPSIQASLTINLASQAGREDWIPVRLIDGPDGSQAEPVFGKSNLIFTLARCDGLVQIEADATGLSAGALVQVFFL